MKRLAAFAATALVCLVVGAQAQVPPEPPRPLANATQIHYDHTTSGLTSTTVQGAIGEVASLVADGSGVAISNRATGGLTFQGCDEGTTSGIQILAGSSGAFVRFQLSIDGSEQGYWKVEAPWGAYDFQSQTATLYPSAASPAISSTLTAGLFTAALSTDAAAMVVSSSGTNPEFSNIWVGPGRALHIYSPVNNCWTVHMSVVVLEPQA